MGKQRNKLFRNDYRKLKTFLEKTPGPNNASVGRFRMNCIFHRDSRHLRWSSVPHCCKLRTYAAMVDIALETLVLVWVWSSSLETTDSWCKTITQALKLPSRILKQILKLCHGTSLQKTVPLRKGLNFTYLENIKSQTSVSHRIMNVSLICPLMFEIFFVSSKTNWDATNLSEVWQWQLNFQRYVCAVQTLANL